MDEMAENMLCPTATKVQGQGKELVQDANNCNSKTSALPIREEMFERI